MADMLAIAGLDDRAFQSGVARVERSSATAAQRFDREFSKAQNKLGQQFLGFSKVGVAAMAGVTGAIAIARSSIEKYGEINSDVARKLQSIDSAGTGFFRSIGRDLAPLLDDLASAITLADKLRRTLTNKALGYLATGGQSAGLSLNLGGAYDKARADQEAADRKAKSVDVLMGYQDRRSIAEARRQATADKAIAQDELAAGNFTRAAAAADRYADSLARLTDLERRRDIQQTRADVASRVQAGEILPEDASSARQLAEAEVTARYADALKEVRELQSQIAIQSYQAQDQAVQLTNERIKSEKEKARALKDQIRDIEEATR
ncbi:MAG: hypothetical protein EBZ59_12960, partial [Planctomycetia bacterium]|nr:hypothetical protein [Planctomycetia bacterium]